MNRQLTTFAVALPALVLPTVALAVAQGANIAHLDQAPSPPKSPSSVRRSSLPWPL
ncbi:hypothetical protein ACTWPT_49375 [Nonomuraea sp. 3N208]|uniref:hypothetical protein n=1 Tax=Nonomuraea sp. 3N208 TaxID=3457421 RepID=UPI003FD4CDEB